MSTPSTPLGALKRLAETRALFILRGLSESALLDVAGAVERAGFSHLEITSDSPGMPGLIARARARAPRLEIGAGTVLDRETAAAVIGEGASFLVSPHTDAALIEFIVSCGAAAIPGAFTPTEILAAHRAGAAAVKLFPGPMATPAGLSDIRGPLPFIRFVPTGSIAIDAIPAWLEAGAFAVGVGRRALLGANAAAGIVAAAELDATLARIARITIAENPSAP
ncbi:MAG: bifunctional 4-hydroxy-2-oxoglutarate aldolase/2-dehydro-3-deoxy-phosphogluconate aldolase [bacterium]